MAPVPIALVLLLSFFNNVKASNYQHFHSHKSRPKCVMFNFGDSNSDTGNGCAAFGICNQNDMNITSRTSDGKLYLDFLSESLGVHYLDPYLESSSTKFRQGVNFAFGSATIEEKAPFSLKIQTRQFEHFQDRTRQLRTQGKGSMISDEEFKRAVYSFDIGQNDITNTFNGSTYEEIVGQIIPEILKNMDDNIKKLYNRGARKFWVYNTGPLGCLPMFYKFWDNYEFKFDKVGCRTILNDASQAFNKGLSVLCDTLRSQLKEATIVYTDMYTIKQDLYANPHKYGFEKPFEACNGEPNLCPYRVSYGGVHYTEAANRVVASEIMSGSHSQPNIKLNDLCRQ